MYIVICGCRLMHCNSHQIPMNCHSEFMQHVGVGLEPLVTCLVSNRQFTYLLTATKPGVIACNTFHILHFFLSVTLYFSMRFYNKYIITVVNLLL